MVELLPCPFCGRSYAIQVCGPDPYDADDYDDDTDVQVVCNVHKGGCGAASAYCRSEKKTRGAWNTRAGAQLVPLEDPTFEQLSDAHSMAAWVRVVQREQRKRDSEVSADRR